MTRRLRHGPFARLVAAVLSLCLVTASVAGAAAHAGDCAHHHGAQVAIDAEHAAHALDHTASTDAVSPAGGGGEPQESQGRHVACMDFLCHGGVAVLAAGSAWTAEDWPTARTVPWASLPLVAISPSTLDRPPKALVSA